MGARTFLSANQLSREARISVIVASFARSLKRGPGRPRSPNG